MGLALIGVVLAVLGMRHKQSIRIPTNLIGVETVAVLVSLVGLISVVFNSTPDYAYVTYVVSMTVWLSAAYTICVLIKYVHKKITVELLTIYLTAVCVCQCIFALAIDSNVAVKNFVDSYVMQDQLLMMELKRLYGIGASLDTAGVRFSACLIMLTVVLNMNKSKMNKATIALSITAYLWIAVVGNMVARTTIIGVGLSLLYALVAFKPQSVSLSFFRTIRIGIAILFITLLVCIYLYDNSEQFHQLSRFAFEGFFNWAETGEWVIDSNEKLKTMIVFPDNVKTWIIGDGYFVNPYDIDATYVGSKTGGYYMGTDIGYCRFIFYFGLVGLFTFAFFFSFVARECILLQPNFKLLILFILLLGFVIWFKVATDVFLVFALLLCVGNMQDKTLIYEEGK